MMRSERFALAALAVALAFGQMARAEGEAAPAVQPAAPAAAGSEGAPGAAPTDPLAASRARAEQRRAEAMAERDRRYEELRARAAEVGLELPQTPPWDQPWDQEMPQPPTMPMMPGLAPPAPLTAAERDAQREEGYAKMRARAAEAGIELPETPPWQLKTPEAHQAYRDAMRKLTPEQRQTLHRLRWEEMRSRARDRGVELPESPPWEQAQKRREAMQERWQAYRETVAAMTDEQREAAAAIFGAGPLPYPPMMGSCDGLDDGPGYDQGRPPFGPSAYPQGPTPPYGSGY